MDIDELLLIGVEKNASDLHIMPRLAPTLRVDGILAPIKKTTVLSPAQTQDMLFRLMTEDEIKKFESQHVHEFSYSCDAGNFRVSVYSQMNGVAGSFRVIPQRIPTMEELQLPEALKKVLLMSRGLVLAAGPCGSGKSTTLAAMIDYINTYRICNIITIEDPIEFIFNAKRSIFNQIQVGRDAVDYSTALRSALRQDPNVIMLGELRDLETMQLALTAVETGHLVLATLHASSASLAVNRFVDVFPSVDQNRVRTLLSETLEAIICQRLIRKSAGGRVGIYELMLATASVRNYIRQDLPANIESSMQTSGDKGMITFEFAVEELVRKRLITPLIASHTIQELKAQLDYID